MCNLFNRNIVDKESAVPLYFQLYKYIEDLINKDILKDGDKLPTEDELVTRLDISRPTIRQAYKELTTKGYIVRKRSKGTIVTKPHVYDKYLTQLVSFRNELESDGNIIKTKVLTFGVDDTSTHIKEMLHCDKYIHLKRYRTSNEIPVVFIDSYIPYDFYRDILNYDMEEESLYDMMQKIGNPVTSVIRRISAENASKEVAKYLNIYPQKSVLRSETIGKDQDDRPVEYSMAYYDGNTSIFQIELKITESN